MKINKPTLLLLVSVILACQLLTACSQKNVPAPEMTTQTVPAEPTDTTDSKTAGSQETVESGAMETTEETVPVISAETTAPGDSTVESTEETTEPNADVEPFDPTFTEDTRPPIIIETPDETVPVTDYETYNNMTEEEQKAFFDSFVDLDAFFEWYNQAKAEYEAGNTDVTIDGSTNIEIKP